MNYFDRLELGRNELILPFLAPNQPLLLETVGVVSNIPTHSRNIHLLNILLTLTFVAKARKKARAVQKAAEDQSQYSKASDDGSYPTDDASEAGLMREHAPKTPSQKDTYKKLSILGPKANITGTLQGTGMRETGSSPADYSDPVDASGEPTMTSQALEAEFAKRLAQMDKYKAEEDTEADDWSRLYPAGTTPAGLSSGSQKKAKKDKKRFASGWSLPMQGLRDISKSQMTLHTGIACKTDGATISAPQPIHERPWK